MPGRDAHGQGRRTPGGRHGFGYCACTDYLAYLGYELRLFFE